MSEVNYNETVVIPVLQKKYQDLINTNLVLEVSLLVEQAKNKDLEKKYQEVLQKIETLSKKKKKEETTLDANTY
jgi:hypothetical protein